MRVVVALGGNALLKGEPMTARCSGPTCIRRRAGGGGPRSPARAVHGNGPQVGLLALQGAAYEEVEAYPLDVLGAQTEGMIGYVLEQELGNLLPFEMPFATVLTMIEVDPADPAFGDRQVRGSRLRQGRGRRLAAENGPSSRTATSGGGGAFA